MIATFALMIAGLPDQASASGPAVTAGSYIRNSDLRWGQPGFTAGWSAQRAADHLNINRVADPFRNYWSPFWCGCASSAYTKTWQTDFRSTFAVLHDYNVGRGGALGYVDLLSPLLGYRYGQINTAQSAMSMNMSAQLRMYMASAPRDAVYTARWNRWHEKRTFGTTGQGFDWLPSMPLVKSIRTEPIWICSVTSPGWNCWIAAYDWRCRTTAGEVDCNKLQRCPRDSAFRLWCQ